MALDAVCESRTMNVSDIKQQVGKERDLWELHMPLEVIPLMFQWAIKLGKDLAAASGSGAMQRVRYFLATDTPAVWGMARTYLGEEQVSVEHMCIAWHTSMDWRNYAVATCAIRKTFLMVVL